MFDLVTSSTWRSPAYAVQFRRSLKIYATLRSNYRRLQLPYFVEYVELLIRINTLGNPCSKEGRSGTIWQWRVSAEECPDLKNDLNYKFYFWHSLKWAQKAISVKHWTNWPGSRSNGLLLRCLRGFAWVLSLQVNRSGEEAYCLRKQLIESFLGSHRKYIKWRFIDPFIWPVDLVRYQ